jgi:hypothetical protein
MTARNQKHIQALLDLATAGEQSEGLTWYQRANLAATRLADQYEIAIDTAAGVIAALSPRNKWDRNLIDAENLIATFVAAGADACEEVKVCTFGANKKKAVQILIWAAQGDIIKEFLSGPKLIEFYSCIIGEDDVCIDGHAYSIWFGDRVTLAKVPSIGKKLREEIKKDYLAVAKKNNLKGYEVQAITWVAHRRIHGVTK